MVRSDFVAAVQPHINEAIGCYVRLIPLPIRPLQRLNMGYPTAIKIAGVALATFLFVHFQGLPWGLLSGAALAMIVLP